MPKGGKGKKAKALRKGGSHARVVLRGRRDFTGGSEASSEEMSNLATLTRDEYNIGRSIYDHDEEEVATPDYSNNNDDQLAENLQKAWAHIVSNMANK